jgi:hypothetical protein
MKKSNLNETTNTGGSGTYRAPVRPGFRLWDGDTLKPFTEKLNGYENAEVYVDSLDGNITTKDIKEKEKKAKKIAKFDMSHPIQNDDDGGNLNNDDTKPELIKKLFKSNVNEDLAVWFGTKKKPKGSKQPKGPWVNICKKDKNGKHPPCGRPEASDKAYPKCRAAGVAGKMTDSEKKSACQQKRRAEKKDTQVGKGQKPVMTSYKPKNESFIIELIRKSLL